MFIDYESFRKIFNTSFWQKLNESLVSDMEVVDKDAFLLELFEEISNYSYSPSAPREYIVVNKHNGISRYIPTFTRKDYCVYFLCVKLLENEIAINRVEGTFGGWTLGNPIRQKEEVEILELEYIPYNTLNQLSWIQEWRNFQSIAWRYRNIDDWHYFTNIDIANFYDCINLSILERQIRHTVTKKKQEVVTLLFHLLRNWNKKLEGYNVKTVGLPQDEIGDCSRILANFYLQDYDLQLKIICDSLGSRYIRFADDQIIFSKTKKDSRDIMFEASKELLKINLNLNSGKVKEFKTLNEFDRYWAFEIFDLLINKEDIAKINAGIDLYFKCINDGCKFREDSVLKRILSIDVEHIEPRHKHRLLAMFYDLDFLAQLHVWHFKRIRLFVNDDDEFFGELDKLVDSVKFNSFHYNLLSFYKKERRDFDLSIIERRILELRLK